MEKIYAITAGNLKFTGSEQSRELRVVFDLLAKNLLDKISTSAMFCCTDVVKSSYVRKTQFLDEIQEERFSFVVGGTIVQADIVTREDVFKSYKVISGIIFNCNRAEILVWILEKTEEYLNHELTKNFSSYLMDARSLLADRAPQEKKEGWSSVVFSP